MIDKIIQLLTEIENAILTSGEIGFDVDDPNVQSLFQKYSCILPDVSIMKDMDMTDVRYYEIERLIKTLKSTIINPKDCEMDGTPLFVHHMDPSIVLRIPNECELNLSYMDYMETILNQEELMCEDAKRHVLEQKVEFKEGGHLVEEIEFGVARASHHHLLSYLFDKKLDYKQSSEYRLFMNLIGFIDLIPTGNVIEDKAYETLIPINSEPFHASSVAQIVINNIPLNETYYNHVYEDNYYIDVW